MAGVAADESVVNKVKHKEVRANTKSTEGKWPDGKPSKANHTKDKQTPGSTCKFCGKTHEFKRELCLAVL